jgi:hypothetical protein
MEGISAVVIKNGSVQRRLTNRHFNQISGQNFLRSLLRNPHLLAQVWADRGSAYMQLLFLSTALNLLQCIDAVLDVAWLLQWGSRDDWSWQASAVPSRMGKPIDGSVVLSGKLVDG